MKSLTPASTFRFSTFTIVFALVVPALFMDGMFADGTLYAAVSRNLANGNGSIWQLHFSKIAHDNFCEQPPLTFALQSLFFRIFGDNIYPERMYDLLMAALNAVLMMRIWKRIFSANQSFAKQDWLPVLLFFISPVTFWAFNNNIIEITMSMFVLACTDALIAALIQEQKVKLNLFFAVTWLFASSLCKGFQGMFPVVLPALFYFSGLKISFKKAFFASLILFGSFLILYAILFLSPSIRTFYYNWYQSRIVNAFNGVSDTSGSHFLLLFELLLDLLPPMGITLFILLLTKLRKKNTGWNSEIFSWTKLFFLYALCGSIPLMVTREQRGFYLLTSLPFYSFALALLLIPVISSWLQKFELKLRTMKFIFIANIFLSVTIFILTIVLAGKPKRDEAILHDIHLTGKFLGPDKILPGDASLFFSWGITNYYGRFYNISLSPPNDSIRTPYYLSDGEKGPEGYERVPLETRRFVLWKKIIYH